MTIRSLVPDDWETWRDLRLRSLADAPDSFGSTSAREQCFSEADWRDRLMATPVVAFVDGTPAAMGGAFHGGEEWAHIIAMWTAPQFRRMGLSRMVLDELVRQIRGQGRRVVLDVTRGNAAARTAYERYGFVATGRAEPVREGSGLLVDEMVLPD
ncbi:MAG: GNAT family N-acetyltransferase [Nocardioides sp.]|nr:GNAT family N-acetyltransferase [Nocardioides sp.]